SHFWYRPTVPANIPVRPGTRSRVRHSTAPRFFPKNVRRSSAPEPSSSTASSIAPDRLLIIRTVADLTLAWTVTSSPSTRDLISVSLPRSSYRRGKWYIRSETVLMPNAFSSSLAFFAPTTAARASGVSNVVIRPPPATDSAAARPGTSAPPRTATGPGRGREDGRRDR